VSANAGSRKGQIQHQRLAHWQQLDNKVSEIGATVPPANR
jgi:hypothetical protein